VVNFTWRPAEMPFRPTEPDGFPYHSPVGRCRADDADYIMREEQSLAEPPDRIQLTTPLLLAGE